MRILVAEKSSFSQLGLDAFSEIAPTDALDLSQEELPQTVKNYDILIVRLGLKVDENVLAAGKKLSIVGTPTTGLDHIDLAAAEEHGITVLSLKGERAFLDQVYATAEHSFALTLSLVRRIPASFDAVKEYVWRRDLYRGREMHDKSMGIVGCGRLGSMMVNYARGFGMRVLIYDPYLTNPPEGVRISRSLSELLEESDVISIHVPLNDETMGMFSDAEFGQCKPGAVLVNTSRGAVINEAALIRTLESGRLAGAAVDVVCNEHQIGDIGFQHPLIEYARHHENVIITPHIGGATQESVEKADLFIVNKIRYHLNIND